MEAQPNQKEGATKPKGWRNQSKRGAPPIQKGGATNQKGERHQSKRGAPPIQKGGVFFLKKIKRFKSIQKIKMYSKRLKSLKVNFEILGPWFFVFSFYFSSFSFKFLVFSF